MPKRTKPRKPNASRNRIETASVVSPSSIRRKKIVKYASIAIVVALIGTFLIGAISSSPAKAAEVGSGSAAISASLETARVSQATPEPDTDGDGIPNNADSDIDGDGIINAVDPDIDGDGIANAKDGDPAATNGNIAPLPNQGSGFQLPQLIPAEFENGAGRITILVLIVGAGAAIIWFRRKRK